MKAINDCNTNECNVFVNNPESSLQLLVEKTSWLMQIGETNLHPWVVTNMIIAFLDFPTIFSYSQYQASFFILVGRSSYLHRSNMSYFVYTEPAESWFRNRGRCVWKAALSTPLRWWDNVSHQSEVPSRTTLHEGLTMEACCILDTVPFSHRVVDIHIYIWVYAYMYMQNIFIHIQLVDYGVYI